MKNAINNKKLLLPLIITTVLVLLLALTACSFIGGNDDDKDTPITFENVVFKDGNAIIEVDGHPTPSNFIPEKEGYTFRYWITEFGNKNSVFEQNEYKGEAITLYAVWKAKEYKVKFVDYDGKVLQVNGQDEQFVEYNTAAIAPTEPTRYGYNFIGWDVSFDQIKKETIVTAQYERKTTTVSFYYGTELLSQKQIYIGDKINVGEAAALKALSKFTSEGFELEGWYADSAHNDKIIMSEATATENMNIFANLKVAHSKGITLETQNPENTFEYADDLAVTVSVNFTEFHNITYLIKWYVDGSEYDGANKKILLEGLTVGKHTVKAVIRSSFGSDYVEDEKSISIIVNKASMYVKANDVTIKYGDPLPTFSYSIRYRNGAILGEAEYSCNYKVGSGVGTYAISITSLESDFYKLIFEEGTLTVEPKPITVKAADTTIVYGDDIPSFNYECGELLNGDSLGIASYTTNYTKGSPVGAYTISLSGLTNKNYDITSYETGSLTVEKMELSFKVVCDNTVYYGDEIPEFDYKITKGSLLEGDSLGTPRYNCEYVKGSDSGRYSVRMTGLRNPNYDFQTSTSAWFQVLPKTVTLTWNTQEAYIYNGLDQGSSISATFTDINGNIAVASIAFNGNGTIFKDAGVYNALASHSNTNYNITNACLQVEIEKLNATVTIDSSTVTYGDDIPAYSYSIEGLLEGESLGTLSFDCDYAKGSEVGKYPLQGTGLTNNNYNINYVDAVLTVEKKSVNVDWVYSDSYIYTGVAQSNTIYAKFVRYDGRNTNLVLSYKLNGVISDFKTAGTYTITANSQDKNYELIGVEKTITIAPKDVHIVFEDRVITYGDEIPSFAHEIEGLVDGETPSYLGALNYTCDYIKNANAGDYVISGENLNNSNYNIIYDSAILRVNKKPATAIWNYQDSYTYNGTTQNETVTAKFMQLDGEYKYMDISFECGDNTDFYHVGTYNVTASSVDEINYDIQDKQKSLTILKARVEVIADSLFLSYGENVPEFSHRVVGLFDGDSLGTLSYICDYTKGSPVNDYPITVEGYQNSDYEIVYTNATLTCTHREVSVTWETQENYTYNRLDQSESVKAIFVNYNGENEEANIEFTLGSTKVFKNVGEYSLVATIADTNYILKNNTTNLTINKKAVEINVQNVTATYGDESVDFNYEVNGVIEGDVIDTSLAFTYTKGIAAGEYPLNVDYTPNENYAVTVNAGLFTLNKRPVTVEWVIGEYTYNGLERANEVSAAFSTYDGNKLDMSVSFSGTASVFKNAGSYILSASYADQNYEYQNAIQNAEIARKDLVISLDNKTIEYGDNASFTYTQVGLVEGDSFGSFTYSSDYTVGSAVNTYAVTIMGASNDNYNIIINDAVLTVNPKQVSLTWDYQEYTYNGSDLSSTVKCYYPSYTGENVNMSLSLSGDYNEFKNAGRYSFTATNLDTNYIVNGQTTVELVINKADYQNITHSVLSGTYDPNKTLSDYLLDSGYRWENSDTTPTVKVSDYPAIYNADSINYNDYSLNIRLSIAKANHTNVSEHTALTGTYDPNKKLSSYTLCDNYYWNTPDTLPTVNVTEYSAYYNTDRDNYNDYGLSIGLTLAKANYQNITYRELSGIYNPDGKLSDYVLDDGFVWVEGETKPIVKQNTYAAIYNADSVNYNDYSLTITLNIAKADYQNITHEGFAGTYNPDKTLATYTLNANYAWVDSTTVPTVPVTEYRAKYNADSDNYNDYIFEIVVTLAKANHTNVSEHTALTGTYDPNKKLSSYTLRDNYYWNTPDTLPTVNVTEYSAYYNTDRDNYNDYPLIIGLTLAKANYQNITYRELSGTYNPDGTLNDYTLDNGFAWVNGNTKPIVKQNTYAAIYNADSVNYNDYSLTITLNIAKADYQNITHEGFVGTYNPDKTLAGYILNANYAWVNSTIVPTVDVTAYSAKYNTDSDNYNDYIFDITITLEKANYTNVAAHTALSGVYSGQQLSAYTLSEGYYWVDATVVPVVNKTAYSAYYNADKVNYNDYAITITLALQKGTYAGITHRKLTGVYSPTKTLASYTLNSNFAWKTPSIVPTCDVTAYNATYNADPDNYNTLELTVQLVLTKATVSLGQTSWSFDYDGTAKTINPTIKYNGTVLASSNYSLSYSIGNSFTDGGIYKTKVTMSSQNYQLQSSGTTCTVTIKSVITSSNSTLTTLESALSSTSSGTVIVKYNTRLYGEATVKSGVTLLIPYDANHDTTTNLTVASGGAPSSAYSTLKIMNGATLTINGNLNVSGRQVTNTGHTTGTYGCMNIEESGYVDVYGNLYCFGFITGSGEVYLNSGAEVTEPLQIKDWPGGSGAYTVYKEFFPFSQFLVANIEAKLTVPYGAKHKAHYTVTASDKEFVGDILMFGQGGLFETTDSNNGSFTKMLDPATGKVTITAYGAAKTNNLSISITVVVSVTMTTDGKEIPIPGYYNIVLENGSNVSISSKFKFLPGSSLTIKQGAVCTITSSGGLIGYDATYSHVYTNQVVRAYGGSVSASNTRINKQVYQSNSPVRIVVDGTLNCSGVLGGTFTTTVAGSKLNLSGASAVSGTIISYYEFKSKKLLSYTNTKYTYSYTAKSNGVTLGKANYTGKSNGFFA